MGIRLLISLDRFPFIHLATILLIVADTIPGPRSLIIIEYYNVDITVISWLFKFKVQIVMNVQTTKSSVTVLALLCLFKHNIILLKFIISVRYTDARVVTVYRYEYPITDQQDIDNNNIIMIINFGIMASIRS